MDYNQRKTGQVNVVHRSIFSKNFFLVILLLTLFALIYLMQRNSIKGMLIDISRMQNKVSVLIQENRKLQTEMYELSSIDRIRRLAERELKMVEPEKPAKAVFYQSPEQSENNPKMLSDLYLQDNIAFRNPFSIINSISE